MRARHDSLLVLALELPRGKSKQKDLFKKKMSVT
jgi:hypothetical protein